AFESALEAIRSQVDQYLVKPAEAHQLVASIAERLREPKTAARHFTLRPLATLLGERTEEIVGRSITLMRESPLLRHLPLGDEERVDHIEGIVRELIAQLE